MTNPLSPRLTAIVLFFTALMPRLPGLSRFLTSDENTNIFFAGSDVIAAFLTGDFRGTYWHFYPGVTMSWLDAIGMTSQYLFDYLMGYTLLPFVEYIYSDILSLVVATRLPYVFLTAASIPALYLLSRKLIPEWSALLGSLFLAFDPFYLAHSRVAHGDAPVAVFMSLSVLTFLVYIESANQRISESANRRIGESASRRGSEAASQRVSESANQQIGESANQRISESASQRIADSLTCRFDRYFVFSAVLGTLAALTKAPGQFIAVFVVAFCAIYAIFDMVQNGGDKLRVISRWVLTAVGWGVISLLVFVLIWPSMWVDPIGTFRQMLDETFGKVNEGHLVYFFGQATLNPGNWFYLYVIPFRLTPVVLIGSLLSLLFLMPSLKRFSTSQEDRIYILLWLFTISLLLFGNLSPKKQDRYLLPLFPFLNLLAAIGWLNLFMFIRSKINPKLTTVLPFLILLPLHLYPVFTYYPYYLTYFNPLMGGPIRAAETTLMGWGEGMEQAAAYLNSKPNAVNLYVASTPSQTLLPYFDGTGENFYTNDIAFRADYVLLYLAQMQRLAPSPEIVRYFEKQKPEKIISIQGVTYIKIYPGPKLILTAVPSSATPINIGLGDIMRLAGYRLNGADLTLYWHSLAPISTDYTVSVRAKSSNGILAQQDSWPVDGLLPTSQWRQGDYITDMHTLDIPTSALADIAQFEVVLYNGENMETVGQPIILPVVEAENE